MARGAAGERLAQLETAITQLGARLRRLEESSSARTSALEQRLGRLEHSLARARHAPVPQPHDNDARTMATTPAARARSLESILIANGISFSKEAFSKTNPSLPGNETKNYSGFERTPSPTAPSSRSWELLRAARRGAALEVQRRLEGVAAPVGRAPALRDGALPLRDLHANRSGGRHSSLHSAARWGRADVGLGLGVAQLLLLEQPVPSAAALEGNDSEPLRLAKSSATARAVAAYW